VVFIFLILRDSRENATLTTMKNQAAGYIKLCTFFSNSDLQDAKKIFQLTYAERKYDVNARAVGVFHTIPCFVVFGSMKQNSAGFSDAR